MLLLEVNLAEYALRIIDISHKFLLVYKEI